MSCCCRTNCASSSCLRFTASAAACCCLSNSCSASSSSFRVCSSSFLFSSCKTLVRSFAIIPSAFTCSNFRPFSIILRTSAILGCSACGAGREACSNTFCLSASCLRANSSACLFACNFLAISCVRCSICTRSCSNSASCCTRCCSSN